MRTVKIRTRQDTCELAKGDPPIGEREPTIIWGVTHCPDDVDNEHVLLMFKRSIIWRPSVYMMRYDELGDGRVVKGPYVNKEN